MNTSTPNACRLAPLDAQIAAQTAAIERFEAALWDGGFNATLLPSYQSAWRRLETLIASKGNDPRHRFVLVIPVADSPVQLRACLDSLIELCNLYGYGGRRDGRWRKLEVMIADDSREPGSIAAHQAIARALDAQGIDTTYFGLDAQRALLASLPGDIDLSPILGTLNPAAFSRKGQASMRNLAWLHLAQRQHADEPVLFYTLDADQTFRVKIPAPHGGCEASALNYFARLDAIFSETGAEVLTGKVVGDPPVSPAVMAGTFLDDVLGFLREMAAGDPDAAYRQPDAGATGGDAAYHDMADLFGFQAADAAYRYPCPLPAPGNADCFDDFAQQLNRFFHGEHPTRITWYRHADVMGSVAPARTVYTGNAVYRPSALRWFIPFAPLRLRMSGPTLGRLLKAELGDCFVSASLPMLHTRTLDATGQSEFRPGVVAASKMVDLCDEFERQFHGDVMLFAIERLAAEGFPQHAPTPAHIAAALDAVQADMLQRYRAKQRALIDKLAALHALLEAPDAWWAKGARHAAARANFHAFAENLAHNFGADSPCLARIETAVRRAHWRDRQLAAIVGYAAARRAWDAALAPRA